MLKGVPLRSFLWELHKLRGMPPHGAGNAEKR